MKMKAMYSVVADGGCGRSVSDQRASACVHDG